MKVSGTGSASGAGSTRRTERGGKRGEFARHLESCVGSPAESAAVDAVSPLAAVDALLAAQSVTDATDDQSRRRLIHRGEEILERLEDIRFGLLAGGLSRERLIELARMVRSRREVVADPRLAAVLDEIELRAEVELAKHARVG